LVVRADRAPYVGGPAEFLYPVEIENPDFGKPLIDPAYQALKTKFPSANIASLRRAVGPGQDIKGFPEETVVAAAVTDDTLYGPTRDWDMSPVNQGAEPALGLGPQVHHNVDARTLIKFDLSMMPKDTKVSGAQLRLTVSNQPYTGAKAGAKIEAYAVRQEWSETEASWNAAKKGSAWTAKGCDDPAKDRFSEAAGSVDIGSFPDKTERFRFVSIDLTELVKKWQSGEAPNYGVLLKFNGGGCVKVHSSEFQDYPFRPTLVLAYSGAALKPAAVAADEDIEAAKTAAKRSNKTLVVKFYSPSCAVCKSVQESTFADAGVKDALAKKYQYVNVKVEDHAMLAQEWGVGSVPAVVVLKPDGAKTVIESDKLKDKAQFLAALSAAPR
jgi:thiol-disulfide isomerase/thioredoxin